jgi:hypothetical protein
MNLTKATFLASAIYLIITVALLISIWFAMRSPDWDTNDSGAAQGIAIFILASISALAYVVVVFPLAAIKIKSGFTTRKWVWTNIVVVFIGSFFLSCIFSYFFAGATSLLSVITESAVLSLLFSIIGLALLAPAMFIWLRFANTHNKSLKDAP